MYKPKYIKQYTMPHQVLEESGQLLDKARELDEGCSQIRVISADEVAAKLV